MQRKPRDIDDIILETYELETSEITATYRTDLRTNPPDVCEDYSNTDWPGMRWQEIGKPYQVINFSKRKKAWEKKFGKTMPIPVQWQHYNRNFHDLFNNADLQKIRELQRKKFFSNLRNFKIREADETLQDVIRLKLWYHIHHEDDAIWDPRGKREMFAGLGVEKPDILVLGAADGYDAMLLMSMYPGSHAVFVDFDEFCRTSRFGEFPGDYPFLSKDPKTGYWNVFNKDDFEIDFEVTDVNNLKYGREFDIVLSSGFIEHYPDKYKPIAFHYHRQFMKPGGFAIFTSLRNQMRLRVFYQLMADVMNYSYRELMDAYQLGLYAHENGFSVLRCGNIKAHNCVVAKER